jgi:hypothetical protein
MAGRDTRVAPRVLRPIHRSLRVVPFGGVDISRRKPFLIIGVASRRRPRARYVAGPKSPAKRGGKILLRGAGADARARRSGLPPHALSGLYDLRILKKKPVQARPRPRPSKHQSLLSRLAKGSCILEPLAEMRRAIGNAVNPRTPFSRAEISEEQVRCSRGGPRGPGPPLPAFLRREVR